MPAISRRGILAPRRTAHPGTLCRGGAEIMHRSSTSRIVRTAELVPALTVALALALLVLAGCSKASTSAASCGGDNRRIVEDFVRIFYVERDVRSAFERYVAADYTQHNPNIADGRDAAIA